MSQGLTRRRAGASPAVGASSSAQLESPTFPSGSTVPRPGSSVEGAASGAYEGRAKIAYDPRDFENSDEKESVPRLTLMEEVLLLGLKDKAVSLSGLHVCEVQQYVGGPHNKDRPGTDRLRNRRI